MKKNVMMRVASIMLVLVLMSSSVISGTFAKYVSEGKSQDKARVAKWGVDVASVADMFKTEYARDDSSFTIAANTVVSSNDDKLVAPGTKGNLTSVTLTGTPEVAVRINYRAEVDLSGWYINGGSEYYCPIAITLSNAAASYNKVLYGLDFTSETEFEEAIEYYISAYTKDYEALTNLGTDTDVLNEELQIAWEWAFEGATEGGTGHANQTDVKDTALGDLAAEEKAAKIDFTLFITATQID